jgi:argininosuccinate lyase
LLVKGSTLWGSGRPAKELLFAFTTDDRGWDAALLRWDVLRSLGHLEGLSAARLVSARDAARLRAALRALLRAAESGRFSAAQDDEDIHSAIERILTARLGAAGARIHTGRSRNDQVAVAVRLWLKDALLGLHEAASGLSDALLAFARRHRAALWPGYTHTRAAMPSSAGQWAHAHACGLLDTLEGLPALWARLDRCPSGSGAGFGVPLALDPAVAAKALGFAVAEPSLAAVQFGRGKLEADALWLAVQLGHDLGRLCADVVLYGGEEFGLLELPVEWTTGSSIMPQKRNPDLFELARARAGEVEGELATMLRLKANLTSGYHRDFQRLKAPLLRGLGTMRGALDAVAAALSELQPRPGAAIRVSGGILAADAALALAERGVPFRTAYRRIAKELADGTFRAEIAPSRLFERRRVAGGLGNLGIAEAAARLRRARGWARHETRRFSAAMARLAGG